MNRISGIFFAFLIVDINGMVWTHDSCDNSITDCYGALFDNYRERILRNPKVLISSCKSDFPLSVVCEINTCPSM